MKDFVWCKRAERRIPLSGCLVCHDGCYPELQREARSSPLVKKLKRTGRFKERYVMKRKEAAARFSEEKPRMSEMEKPFDEGELAGEGTAQRIFLLEDGRLKPFSMSEYTRSVLYDVVESFSVECRLVKPEDSDQPIYEGKKPSRKTVPILVTRSGETVLMPSWEELEAHPEKLADVDEVIGALPVKQVFVLKRKP
ncbi:MAG: hypothetical protein MUC41_07105 [Syntrophobacteraceae bacterium]|nr:hypothetical protein [Syntrophobacteraceae bacterium]